MSTLVVASYCYGYLTCARYVSYHIFFVLYIRVLLL